MTDTPNTQPADSSTPLPDVPAPAQMTFTDHGPIEGEPTTDVKITLASGLVLRERMIETASDASTALNANAAPIARTISISNALLDADGKVVRDAAGQPQLSSRHELTLTNEALGRLATQEAVTAAVLDARQIAAAKADTEFRGVDLFASVLATRTAPIVKATAVVAPVTLDASGLPAAPTPPTPEASQ